jgi:hypothetical protein
MKSNRNHFLWVLLLNIVFITKIKAQSNNSTIASDYFVASSDIRVIDYKQKQKVDIDLSQTDLVSITIPNGNNNIVIKLKTRDALKAEDINIFINDKKQIKE